MLKRTQKLFHGLQGNQAYRQTPWRRQMRMLGFFAAIVAALALLAGLYLNVAAMAATAGRKVQDLQAEHTALQQKIENLQSQLAELTSIETMQKRAKDMGFSPMESGAITYLAVDGYKGRPAVQLAPRAGSQFGTAARLPAAYTQSIFDWIGNLLSNLGGL